MKKIFFLLVYVLNIKAVCFSQNINSDNSDGDGIFLFSRRDFAKANISEKLDLINEAANSEDEKLFYLFKDALKFVSFSYDILGNDPQLLEIGIKAAEKLGMSKDKTSAEELRFLFISVTDERFKTACINALSELELSGGGANENFVLYLNKLYENALEDVRLGKPVKIDLLTAYANALGRFASPSSFKTLSKTLLYPVNEKLISTVKTALTGIPINYFEEIKAKIEDNDILYVYTLFSLAKDSPKIGSEELGQIAEASFNAAVKAPETDSAKELKDECLRVFAKMKLHNAAGSVVKYFYKVKTDYKNGKASVEELIKVIDCMGQLGSIQCVQAVAAFLNVLNSETETAKAYNEPLVLSTISAAGELGNKIAFDYLIYAEYLEYSPEVKKAARTAAARLKW